MDNKIKDLIPLMAFTFLMIIASGLSIGSYFSIFAKEDYLNYSNQILISILIVIVAFIISFLHITKKVKSFRALSGIKHSMLSIELFFSSAFLFSLIFSYVEISNIFVIHIIPVSATRIAPVFLAVASLMSIGLVYNLMIQKNWNRFYNTTSPLITALILAVNIYAMNVNYYNWTLYACLVLLDFGLSYLRLKNFNKIRVNSLNLLFPKLNLVTYLLYILRSSLSLAIYAFLYFKSIEYNIYLIIVIILLDRVVLYTGTAQINPVNTVTIERDKRLNDAL